MRTGILQIRNYRTVYTSPLVRDAADWLEEHGDPGERFVALKEMKVEQAGTWRAEPLFRVITPNSCGPTWPTKADATRELLRRALAELTVKCDTWDCMESVINGKHQLCSGRGWLPAWTELCNAWCHLDGNDELCKSCQGRKWIKVPEKSHVR